MIFENRPPPSFCKNMRREMLDSINTRFTHLACFNTMSMFLGIALLELISPQDDSGPTLMRSAPPYCSSAAALFAVVLAALVHFFGKLTGCLRITDEVAEALYHEASAPYAIFKNKEDILGVLLLELIMYSSAALLKDPSTQERQATIFGWFIGGAVFFSITLLFHAVMAAAVYCKIPCAIKRRRDADLIKGILQGLKAWRYSINLSKPHCPSPRLRAEELSMVVNSGANLHYSSLTEAPNDSEPRDGYTPIL